MKKTFANVGIIAVSLVGVVMLVGAIQIARLQKEMDRLKRDVYSLQSQTAALNKKILEDLTCFAANGKIGRNGYGEKVCDIDKKDMNFFDWVEIEKMQQAGWMLVNINASGKNAKTEGEIFFNLIKEHKIAGIEKIAVENFYLKGPLSLGLWFRIN